MQVNRIHKVAVIDNDLVSRTGLITLIDELLDFKVAIGINETESKTSLLSQTDVILYSIRSLTRDTTQILNQLIQSKDKLPIIIYSPSISIEDVYQLVKIRVKGIIEKEATSKLLSQSLICAINRGTFYPNAINQSLAEILKQSKRRTLAKAAFSDLQIKILNLLASGKKTFAIADELCRSTRTIEWHKQEMMKLTGLSSTSQLLLFAVEYNVIESPFAVLNESLILPDKKEEDQLMLS